MDLKPTAPVPLAERPPELATGKQAWWRKPTVLLGGVLALLLIGVLGAIVWYNVQLQPVNPGAETRQRVTIETGMTPDQIADLLAQKHLIHSALVFTVYTRIHQVHGELQAGVYSLSASESVQDIVKHFVDGKTDEFTITFFPGATLTDNTDTSENKKVDVTHVLLRAGYSEEEIKTALAKTYDSPLFTSKPASASLEGYIYGDTYKYNSDDTVEEILARTFSEFNDEIQRSDVMSGLEQQGLTLYQGITLASIIQREVSSSDPSSPSADQQQVAQVFYSRLAENMPLGSDVTAYYGADMLGVPRSVAVDTPYNTRIHAGLPPGPIAVPSIGALEAAAHPAAGDYLYFLSGDDDKTYFARTNDEHEQNIANHCHIKCQIP